MTRRKEPRITPATKTVRDQGFEPLECSIPPELTIAEYRDRRRQAPSDARSGEQSSRPARRRLSSLVRR